MAMLKYSKYTYLTKHEWEIKQRELPDLIGNKVSIEVCYNFRARTEQLAK